METPELAASGVTISRATTAADYFAFGTLVRKYLRALDFSVEFQDVSKELDELPIRYGQNGRGVALLASVEDVVGIAGVHDLASDRCELKRMYVLPDWRRQGIGRLLCVRAIEEARGLGFKTLCRDTLERMEAASNLYRALGFKEASPYYVNPVPDAVFLELAL